MAKRAARLASHGVRTLGGRLGAAPAAAVHWVADRPQVLVPVAVVAGVVSLLLAVLVVFGVVQLYGPETPPPGTETSVGESGPGERPEDTPGAGPTSAGPGPDAGESPPDWLKRFQRKYPTTVPTPPKRQETTSDVEFFGVKGEKRRNGSSAD